MLAGISEEWLKILDKPELKQIESVIDDLTPGDKLCPPKQQWFEWARLTPLDEIKVIIIGQDPYATPGTAHGLAFSSLDVKIPPSLKNIYECLRRCNLLEQPPSHANLTSWTKQGVLLLNAALSTELKIANHHARIWAKYTINIMKDISEYGKAHDKHYTYLLWGNFAQKFKSFVDPEWHAILEWIHPSPLAQSRAQRDKKFIKCDHFKICNEKYGIDWAVEDYPQSETNDDELKNAELKKSETKKITTDPKVIQVFTDGSCFNNGRNNATGGFAAIFVGGILKGKKIHGKINGKSSNIRAEGKAIIYSLEKVKQLNTDDWKKLEIYTDSMFWIDMVNKYMPKWPADKFDKQANPDLTKKLWQLWNEFPNHELELIFIPAHDSKNWSTSASEYEQWCYRNNNEVDILAKNFLRKS